MIKKFQRNFKFIENYYNRLLTLNSDDIDGFNKVIVDNFHILLNAFSFMEKENYKLKSDRVFYFLKEVINKSRYNVDFKELIGFLNKYQKDTKSYLSYEEIYSIKVILICIYIGKLSELCLNEEDYLNSKLAFYKIESFEKLEEFVSDNKHNSHFLFLLYRRIQYNNSLFRKFIKLIYENKISLNEVIEKESDYYLNQNQIVINIIDGIQSVLSYKRKDILNQVSKVEKELLKRKYYKNMTDSSKNIYRTKFIKFCCRKKYDLLDFLKENKPNVELDIPLHHYLPVLDYKNSLRIGFSTVVMTYIKEITQAKVDLVFERFEEYYHLYNSKNIYYTLVCDHTCDLQTMEYIMLLVSQLNKKYNTKIFHFICVNQNIDCEFLMLDSLNKIFLNKLGKHKDLFIENTFSNCNVKFKYAVVSDFDKSIGIDSIVDLIGTIVHPLNENRNYILIEYKNKHFFHKSKNYIYDIYKFNEIFSSVSSDDKNIKRSLIKNGLKIGCFLEMKSVNDEKVFDGEIPINYPFVDHAMFVSSNKELDTMALSNGNYTVLLDSLGRSISKYRTIKLNSYSENGILYIRDTKTNFIWTNTCFHDMSKCNYTFFNDKAKFVCEEDDIKIATEIIVSRCHNVEIKKITITNKTSFPKTFELTTYYDLVLSDHNESKIFINSDYDEKLNALISNRCGKNNYIFHKFILPNALDRFSYTTDKSSLFDSKGNIKSLDSLDNKLSNNLEKIMSFQNKVDIHSKETVSVYLISGYARGIDQIHHSINYFSHIKNIEEEYKRSTIHSAFYLDHLNISREKEMCYHSFLKFLIEKNNYNMSLENYDILRRNSLSKSSLMKYRLDTMYPIVLLEIKDMDKMCLLYDFLKMYEYYKSKSIFIQFIILVDHLKFNHIRTSINNELYRIHHIYNSYKKNGSVLVLNSKKLSREEKNLFNTISNIRIDSSLYLDFFSVLEELDKTIDYNSKTCRTFSTKMSSNEEDLFFDNSYGGFSHDLDNYVIYNNSTPREWSNILSNKTFGSIVTNHGYSYTYFDNPSEFRITDLNHNSLSEGFKFNDLLFKPSRCIHGFGYTILEGSSEDLDVSITQFVPISDSVKVYILDVSNKLNKKLDVLINYFIHPILGSSSDDYKYVLPDFDLENNFLKMRNVVHLNYKDVYTFVSSTHKIDDYHIHNISRKSIDTHILLKKKESIRMVFTLGCSKSEHSLVDIVEKYQDLGNVDLEFSKLKTFWKEKLNLIDVHTCDNGFNIMTSWSLYQEISNRYFHANYYGYKGISNCREKLLSALHLLVLDKETLKEQILLSASHQFIKGDILYWFYDKNKFGLRNKSFDTHLIFAYSVLEYISTTLDYDILSERVPYIYGNDIGDYEKEKIVVFRNTEEAYTILDHLIKAIDLSISLVGHHTIPLIDQNDFDGVITNCCFKGESMVLGFILYSVISNFITVLDSYDDHIDMKPYEKFKLNLRKSLNSVGFLDDHYVRGLFDNGDRIGSDNNLDVNIDLLSQSFSILSDVILKANVSKVLKRVDRDLYDPSTDILKYISSPFDNCLNDLGIISSYPAGYFENGASSIKTTLFYVNSLLKLGYVDKANKYFHGINPLNRDITDYRIEPYFVGSYIDCLKTGYIDSDYTPGLFYRTLIQGFLGFNKIGNTLTIKPNVSEDFSIVYHHFDTSYIINVKFDTYSKYIVDGKVLAQNEIELINDKKKHIVEVFMKRK